MFHLTVIDSTTALSIIQRVQNDTVPVGARCFQLPHAALQGKPYAENISSHLSLKTYNSCYTFLSYVEEHMATPSRGLSSATAIVKVNCIVQLSMSSHLSFTCNTNLASFSGVHYIMLHNISPAFRAHLVCFVVRKSCAFAAPLSGTKTSQLQMTSTSGHLVYEMVTDRMEWERAKSGS